LGVSGGTGSLGIMFAKHLGASFIATTCSASNAELVKSLGADMSIDYEKEEWWKVLADEKDKVDCVFDTVGGYDSWKNSWEVTKSGGHFVTLVGDNKEGEKLSLGSMIHSGFSGMNRGFWSHFHYPTYDAPRTAAGKEGMLELKKVIEDAKIKPVIDSKFPLEQIHEAMKKLSTKRTKGKIVILLEAEEEKKEEENKNA